MKICWKKNYLFLPSLLFTVSCGWLSGTPNSPDAMDDVWVDACQNPVVERVIITYVGENKKEVTRKCSNTVARFSPNEEKKHMKAADAMFGKFCGSDLLKTAIVVTKGNNRGPFNRKCSK